MRRLEDTGRVRNVAAGALTGALLMCACTAGRAFTERGGVGARGRRRAGHPPEAHGVRRAGDPHVLHFARRRGGARGAAHGGAAGVADDGAAAVWRTPAPTASRCGRRRRCSDRDVVAGSIGRLGSKRRRNEFPGREPAAPPVLVPLEELQRLLDAGGGDREGTAPGTPAAATDIPVTPAAATDIPVMATPFPTIGALMNLSVTPGR